MLPSIMRMPLEFILPSPEPTVTTTKGEHEELDPDQREHIPPLDGADVAAIFTGQPRNATMVAKAHNRSEPRWPRHGLVGNLMNLIAPEEPDLNGQVWVSGGLVHYKYRDQSGFVVLRHVVRAVAHPGQLDLVLSDHTFHLPLLCRSKPLAYLINAILQGSYDPTAPFRPACRSCQHLTEDKECGTQPPMITYTECCRHTQHLDWCPAYRAAA